MYTTPSIPEAAFLLTRGHRLHVRANGFDRVVFEFETLSEEQAAAILTGPDAGLCISFHRSWRDVRKRMDAVRAAGAIR